MKVPPFLELVVNVGTFYANLAPTDARKAFMCAADTIKYHVHLLKEGYSLPDSMHYLPDSKPRTPQPPSTSHKTFSAIMDEVCGEPSAVEDASNEASAALRQSDEPELGSPAALLQQANRVIRTIRPACHSRKKRNIANSI